MPLSFSFLLTLKSVKVNNWFSKDQQCWRKKKFNDFRAL